ncbi:MAG: hypothetical protein KH332_09550 [Firmicutes bacterium]|nr:hypothetical protein [Bacillota bacterium]
MAFDDAALERALRAETKGGLTLCGGESELTVIGCGWMAVIPEIELRDRLRGTLGALVEMLGYIPENDTVWIVRNKGGYLVQPELPETVGEEICGYAGETHTEEIRPTGLRLGLDFLMQKKTGEIVGVTQRGASLGVRRYSITPGGIVRQEDGDTGERLYRRSYRPREDTDSEATLRKWRHLEVMSWCDWDAPEE